MKKIGFVVLMLLFFGGLARGQNKRFKPTVGKLWCDYCVLPIDSSTQKYTYTGVVEVQGAKADLYKRAENFAIKSIGVTGETIIVKDTTGKIVFRKLKEMIGGSIMGGVSKWGEVNYDVTLLLKDGKYKYIIDNFKYTPIASEFGSKTQAELETYLINLKENLGKKYRVQIISQIVFDIEGYDTNKRPVLGLLEKMDSAMKQALKKDDW